MNTTVFWDLKLCGLREVGGSQFVWCQTTGPHIPEYRNLHGHCHKNLKWHRMAWHFRGRIVGKQVEIKHLSNTVLRGFVVATLSQITKYEVCSFCCWCWNSVL